MDHSVTGGTPDLGVTAPTHKRVALVWLAAATTAYAVAFVLLAPLFGPPIMALLLVLTSLAGWWLGTARGAVAAIALVLLNQALALALGNQSVVQAGALPGLIPGALVAVASAIALGALRERQALLDATRQRLQEQLLEGERMTATLGASEERFRMLAEEALIGVYLIQDNVFQYVNAALAHAFGYEPEEIIGRFGKLDLTAPEDHALVRGNLEARLSRASQSEHYRFRGLRKDGSRVPVEVFGRALEVDGRPAILGTLQDRTREETDEAELRLRLRALEAAPVGIVITTPDGTIEWANHHAAELTGYANDELIGEHTRLFQSGKQGRAFYQGLWDTVTAGRIWTGELINRRKDGTEYHEHMSINPVPNADGGVSHFVAAKQDVTQRRTAEQRIHALNTTLETHIGRLQVLRAIDDIVTSGLELRSGLKSYVDIVHASLGADALWINLHHEGNDTMELLELRGWHQPPEPGFELPLENTLVGKAITEKRRLVLRSRREIVERFPDDPRLAREGFEVFGAVPMEARGTLRGGLAFAFRSAHPIDPDWLDFVNALAVQGAILIESATLLSDLRTQNEELQRAYDATIEGWSRALDLRDKETEGHCRRVTELTLRLARAMGVPDDDLIHIRRGALLHDIGKMGVPDAILQKPGKLTQDEWRVMKRHPTAARDLLAPIAFLGPALEIPFSHHERWDGTGYPRGLQGNTIPLSARIFAIIDVYDALTSDRPYRRAWTRQQTLEHIREGAGTHFDPRIVETFLAMQSGSTT